MDNETQPSAQPASKPMPIWGKILLASLGLIIFNVILGQALRLYRWKTEGEFGFADEALSELSRLRDALQRHKAEAGSYPKTLDELNITPKKVQLHTPRKRHSYTADVTLYSENGVCAGEGLKDTGGWGYVSDPASACYGRIFLDSMDLRKGTGKAWWTY